jgi:hypothetical protein
MQETKTTSEDVQPNDLPADEEALSPEELGEISGGFMIKRGGDPCEGGEVFHP